MIVMPANSSGSFWHVLARETGKIGHLFSPGGQRGPWPWFPYALDNGAYSCWDRDNNTFDDAKWAANEAEWRRLLFWTEAAMLKPMWGIVPDVPGNKARTLERYPIYAPELIAAHIPVALAVQDGMTPDDVHLLEIQPAVICVGGSTEWKWDTVEMWAKEFPRVHLLRCNRPTKLDYLENLGIESCDGTGWKRGDHKKSMALEEWCRRNAQPRTDSAYRWLLPRKGAKKNQTTFA